MDLKFGMLKKRIISFQKSSKIYANEVFWTSQESSETYIFRKLINELSENTNFIDFGQVFHKLWKYKWNLTTFGMTPHQIWSYHVTQGKTLSFYIQKLIFH